jgi:hypothetical protein
MQGLILYTDISLLDRIDPKTHQKAHTIAGVSEYLTGIYQKKAGGLTVIGSRLLWTHNSLFPWTYIILYEYYNKDIAKITKQFCAPVTPLKSAGEP